MIDIIFTDINVVDNINVDKCLESVSSDELWLFAAENWHSLYYPFIPFDTGETANNVSFAPGQITHNAPHAPLIYNSGITFKKDKHPLASMQWDKAAESIKFDELLSIIQQFIDDGGLKFEYS